MIVLYGKRPPNYEAIVKVFPIAAREGTIFAYGDYIYTMAPVDSLKQHLIEHESVHSTRQKKMGVEGWWERYLVDTDFRYEEELLAHRMEYRYLAQIDPFEQSGDPVSRQQRRFFLVQTAKRLASPLYGKVVTLDQAKKEIAA